ELGLFGASFRIIEVLMAVPALVAGAALPIFARAAKDDHDRLGYALGRVFEVALIAGIWVSISIVIGAHLAIEVVGGHKFAGAVSILQIQGVALGATFVSTIWSTGLLSLSMHKQILILNVGALLFTTALLAVLVPLSGADGAAISILCGETAAAIAGAAFVLRAKPSLKPSLERMPKLALAT